MSSDPAPHPAPLDAIAQHLADEFGLPPPSVRSLVAEVLDTFADARLREFVPVLIEKQARDRLRHARGAGEPSTNGHRIET